MKISLPEIYHKILHVPHNDKIVAVTYVEKDAEKIHCVFNTGIANTPENKKNVKSILRMLDASLNALMLMEKEKNII